MSSEDFFRFGDKYTNRLLKYIGVSYIDQSRIDGSSIFKIDRSNYKLINELESYFKLDLITVLEDHFPIMPQQFCNKKSNETYLMVIDFSGEKWRNFRIKETRKEKLKKINESI
jgi:hypothetical protein